MEFLVLKVHFKSATWGKETKAKQTKKLGVLCWNIVLKFRAILHTTQFLSISFVPRTVSGHLANTKK